MIRYIFLVTTFFFSILVESFCLPAEEPPQRIISLGPAITEELYLLGAEDRLVGCTLYCQRPPEAKTKEKVGTVIDVNVEKIASLKPDLILATSLTNPNDIEKLERLKINPAPSCAAGRCGIKVISFPTAKNFSQICQHFLELGRIVGKEKEAQAIVERETNKVDSINAKIKTLSKPKVFIQTGARPLYTASKESFVHDYITRAGGINIAADSKGGFDYGIYSREQVIKDNPDVIIIVTMGITGEKEKVIWKRFRTLNAVKNNRIHIVDSHKMCSPTPVSFVEMLKEVVRLLHPELNEIGKGG